ncbi:hypothetical protein RRG08_002266 [Elysia crispata]|uniref:F-box domain-containing protein n=1 Tax=Elysia crispata TaxID=231223 RepID=A0AAE0ZB58_9GAST|nr:hypothetical protein RRG08_002266 [Elysia crispata]
MPVNIDIPYRCPNCGDQLKFSTLNELRCHLEDEHSYQYSRSRRRVNISDFDGPTMHSSSMSDLSKISPLVQRFHEDTLMLEEEVRKNKEVELNNKRYRASSVESLLDRNDNHSRKSSKKIRNSSSKVSFRDYGLPSRLTHHLNYSPRSRKHTNREHSGRRQILRPLHDDDLLDDSNPQQDIDEHILDRLSRKMRDDSEMKPSNTNMDSKHVAQALHALSKEVMIERASQQATAESLYSANETLFGVERAAEERIALQQRVIENLAEELKDKEKRLTSLMEEMDHLREQQATLKNANVFSTKLDFESKYLQQELAEKQWELDALAKNVENARQFVSVDNLKDQVPEKMSPLENTVKKSPEHEDNRNKFPLITQDNKTFTVFHANGSKEPVKSAGQEASPENTNEDELKSVKHKAQQLEKDRHSLLLEMQGLLESAAVDNEKLRQELHRQEQKMGRMNLDLKSSKHEQAELLGETHELYHQADVGLTKLKMMLKERDRQLSGVSSALEQAREIQEKLVRERDESLKQAAEREGMYRAMLSANSDQLKTMKEALASNQESKHILEMNLQKLNHQLESKGMDDLKTKQKVDNLAAELRHKQEKESKLKGEVQRREEKLKKAKSEMERMTDFLRKTSDKETSARMKLEGFISKLLERAEKAESELKELQKEKVRKSKYPKKRSMNQDKHQDKSYVKYSDKPHSSSLDRATVKSYGSSDNKPLDEHYERSFDSPDKSSDRPPFMPFNRPSDRHFENFIREEDATKNFALLPPSDSRHNVQFPSAAGLIASYPPQSESGTRPTFASVPMSLQPQNPFYLHRPRRQTYTNTASMYSIPSVPAYEYDAAPQRVETEQLFQNTPEINSIIRNVQRQSFLSSYNPVSLKGSDSTRGTIGKKKYTPISSMGKMDFSLDEDGIMWERHATPSPYHSLKAVPVSARKPQVLNPDDTDIGEVSDFVYDDEQKSHEESEDADDILNQSHRVKIEQGGKTKRPENVQVPRGKKNERLFLVSEPYALSPEKQNNYERANYHLHDAVVEDSDASPLHKAKEVQKRMEEWTASKKAESSLFSSRGFDADNMAVDSDFSTSSYTSFKRTREPAQRDADQMKKNEVTHTVDVEPIRLPKHMDASDTKQAITTTSIESKKVAELDRSEPPPVLEEVITPTPQNERIIHRFAGQMLKKTDSSQQKLQNENLGADNDISDKSEFTRRTNSLPVTKAQEEATLLSQAELNLQENTESQKIVPKRQISIIQASSFEEMDASVEKDEQMPEKQFERAISQDFERAHETRQEFNIGENKETNDNQSENFTKSHGGAESPVLDSQVSDAVNAETATENDSPDEPISGGSYNHGNQTLTRNDEGPLYHSSEGVSSSDDEEPDGGKGDHNNTEANEIALTSVDASTDTDLEKLSQPGHAYRGLTVRKNTPVVRHVMRKRPKKVARKDASQQSLSSADELDSSAKSHKKAIKNMRVALFHIFSYLDTNELLSVSLVCKQWCKVSRHPALWKVVSLHDRSISSEFLVTLSNWCTKTEYLSLQGSTEHWIKRQRNPG